MVRLPYVAVTRLSPSIWFEVTSGKIANCWKSIIREVSKHENLTGALHRSLETVVRFSEKLYILEIYEIKTLLGMLVIPTWLFNVIVIDLIWVACLLQSVTDCFRRSCKITKKSLLHLDISNHGYSSMKLFGSHNCCYNGQQLLNSLYFKHCFNVKRVPFFLPWYDLFSL